MKLANQHGSSFSLDIVGYQYSDLEDQFWDANWLFVQIQLQVSEQSWAVKDPCLTTFEVQLIIDWLQRLAVNGNGNKDLVFTEPTIQFKLNPAHNGKQSLRVIFRPPPQGNTSQLKDNISLDFPLEQVPFSEIIENLQIQLDRFPQRVFRDRFQIAISGLNKDEVEISQNKLKEGFDNQTNIRKADLKWDVDQSILIAGIVHDYPRQTTKEAARETVRTCAISALSFSANVFLAIYDQRA
jgi:hypothetical protein